VVDGEVDAPALAAIPEDYVRPGVREQPRRAEHPVEVVAVGERIALAVHRYAREVRRHLGKVGEDRERHALDHRVRRGRDRADENPVRREGG
jgi:hypothetical protein